MTSNLVRFGAMLAMCALASATHAEEFAGPPIGNVKYTAEIRTLTDRPDTDDFVGEMMEGELLDVIATSAKKSDVRLGLTVVDPDGLDRTANVGVNTKKEGVKAFFKKFVIDKTGQWTVRVSGLNDTQGDYAVTFKVKKPATAAAKKQTLGGADPAVRTHTFGGVDGALVDIQVKTKKGTSVKVLNLRGPDGQVSGIFGDEDVALIEKGSKVLLKKHELDAGIGTYSLDLGIASDDALYDVTIKLTSPPRAPSKKATITSINDPQLVAQPIPVRSAAGQPVRVLGRNFSTNPIPTVRFGPFVADVVEVGPARDYIDVVVPPGADGSTQSLFVINPDGQGTFHETYIIYVAAAVITQAAIIQGPIHNTNEVLRTGGAVIEVTGLNFLGADALKIGGNVAVRSDLTDTSFKVTVPVGTAGLADLQLTDEFGRVQTVASVIRYVGFDDITSVMFPTGTATDDRSAYDIAVGDLDGDGRINDMVLATYNQASRPYPLYYPNPGQGYAFLEKTNNSIGARGEYTRTWNGNKDGVQTDTTASDIPSALSDTRGVDDWNARAIVLGDIDGMGGIDIVIGGSKGPTDMTENFAQVRILTGSGSGSFALAETLWPTSPVQYSVTAFDETYVMPDPEDEDPVLTGIWNISSKRSAPTAVVTLALGDLDGDGDNEIVAGQAGFGYRYVNLDASYVDYTQDPPYISSADINYIQAGYYFSGTRVFENQVDVGNGFPDVSETWLPSVGSPTNQGLPAFLARHVALGDVDMDQDLDMLVTFNNPASHVPSSVENSFGYYRPYSYGVYAYYYDSTTATVAVATRVLLNDGSGGFTDGTATWMPSGSGVEWWQGHRIVLFDLDADGDLDLVIGHRRALNEYKQENAVYDRSSLRILRNDYDPETLTGGFVDVTSSALPPLPGGPGGVFRGRSLAVGDIDKDGFPEIVVGAAEVLTDGAGGVVPSTRILWGRTGLTWALDDDFILGTVVDTGEASTILLTDIDRDGVLEIVQTTELDPGASPGSEHLRIKEWQRGQ